MKKQKVPKILIVLLVVLVLVFVVSAVMVVTQLVRDQHEDSAFEELASRVHQASSEATEPGMLAGSVGEEPAAANDLDSSSSDAQQPSGETAPSVAKGSESVGEQGAVTSDTQQASGSIIQPPAVDGLDSSSSDAQQPSTETAPSSATGSDSAEEHGAATSDAQQTSHPIIQSAAENASESVQEKRVPLPMYAELLIENPDLFGWITIEDTKVDYPVMYTPSDPQYYLHRAFDHSYSYSGTPFLSAECYEGCGNYIVYGHHMKNQTMFGSLSRYASRSHWEKHKIIRFDTVYASGSYEVVAAFNARVYGDDERNVFRYYDYTDLTDEARFDEFMAGVRAEQMYDTDVEVNFGDDLLTLITCNYHVEDGRFVVVARKIQ